MEDLVAGIDIATQAVRVVVCDAQGRQQARSNQTLPPPHRPRAGWSEQDAGAWWPGVTAALKEATGALGDRSSRISSLAVSATSGTVVIADDDGEAVGPAPMYDDRRSSAEAGRAQEAAESRWETLGLRITASFGLPKWGWLLAQPEIAGGARWAWHVPDLVLARLTGEPTATDTSHALKSGYDPLRREWAEEAMEALDIPVRLLPEVAPPATEVGTVSRDAASATGLPSGCPVHLGMTDSCASQLAAGADQPGRFVSVLGTTLAVKGASHDLLRDPTGAVYSHWHPDGWWLPGGASNTGGAVLKERFSDADPADLDRQAGEHGPASVVSYPLIGSGERFPFVSPDAEGFTTGSPSSQVDSYRAALEGVAFIERLAYAHLHRLGARIEPPLAVAGAGSRSWVWNSVRATVLGLPLVVPERAETAFGACILAASGSLHNDLSEASRAFVRLGDRVEPVEQEREQLQRSYEQFVSALDERGWLDARLKDAALSPLG